MLPQLIKTILLQLNALRCVTAALPDLQSKLSSIILSASMYASFQAAQCLHVCIIRRYKPLDDVSVH